VWLEFVRGHLDASQLEFSIKAEVEASGQEEKDLVENGLESDNNIKEKVPQKLQMKLPLRRIST
jgi:hypothetical protein